MLRAWRPVLRLGHQVFPTTCPILVKCTRWTSSISNASDPLLVNTEPRAAQSFQPIDIPIRLERPNETIEAKRSRLLYQSRKRGILEMDLLLSTFCIKQLPLMDNSSLDALDTLMDENDWDLYYWLTEEKPIPEDIQSNPMIPLLKEHVKNTGKHVRRMPDL